MTVPVLVLLAFAAWTVLALFGTVGVYRWSQIFTRRASISEWQADVPQGSEIYRRAMRAHMNCVENLPLLTALVVALLTTGVSGKLIDALCIVILVARVSQTIVHVMLPTTNAAAALRFALFLTQIVCMTAITAAILRAMPW